MCPGVKEVKQREAVASCPSPAALTTGMSVSVALPQTAMLVCSSLKMYNVF